MPAEPRNNPPPGDKKGKGPPKPSPKAKASAAPKNVGGGAASSSSSKPPVKNDANALVGLVDDDAQSVVSAGTAGTGSAVGSLASLTSGRKGVVKHYSGNAILYGETAESSEPYVLLKNVYTKPVHLASHRILGRMEQDAVGGGMSSDRETEGMNCGSDRDRGGMLLGGMETALRLGHMISRMGGSGRGVVGDRSCMDNRPLWM